MLWPLWENTLKVCFSFFCFRHHLSFLCFSWLQCSLLPYPHIWAMWQDSFLYWYFVSPRKLLASFPSAYSSAFALVYPQICQGVNLLSTTGNTRDTFLVAHVRPCGTTLQALFPWHLWDSLCLSLWRSRVLLSLVWVILLGSKSLLNQLSNKRHKRDVFLHLYLQDVFMVSLQWVGRSAGRDSQLAEHLPWPFADINLLFSSFLYDMKVSDAFLCTCPFPPWPERAPSMTLVFQSCGISRFWALMTLASFPVVSV